MAGERDKKDAMAAANIAIVKSGTVTLEVAMAGTPMIVTYRVNALSAWVLEADDSDQIRHSGQYPARRGESRPGIATGTVLAADDCGCGGTSACTPRPLPRLSAMRPGAALAQLIPPDGQRPSDKAASVILRLIESAKTA